MRRELKRGKNTVANKKKTIAVTFERSDAVAGKKKRLPTHKEMLTWIQGAAFRSLNLTICFVTEEESHRLDKTYRKKDRPTNVLTFDYAHEPVAEADIAVCTAVLVREAAEQKKTFRSHLAHMLIHATLHAQGWDHATDAEAEEMEALEAKILKKLGFPNPYSDRAVAH
jgi:probable rRNA maturation factor